MPCSSAKARLLLKDGKAKVVTRTPFTIKLLHGSAGYKQDVTAGVDTGYKTIGVSAVANGKELYAAEVEIRTDIVELNSERSSNRRNRRSRKTWYRKPGGALNTKPKGWLPPSINHKIDTHVKVVNNVGKILPIKTVNVEVAAFDIQKIKDPAVSGVGYQFGDQYGYANVREYVLYRDTHRCRHCKGKSKYRILQVHHLVSRKTGGDRPDNLVTLCKTCHDDHHAGRVVLKVGKPPRGFKAETFMNMMRHKIVERLKSVGWNTKTTFGYETKVKRSLSKIQKSHANDALVIAGGTEKLEYLFGVKQFRKCNRKLHKGSHSQTPNTAPRFVMGFQRYDKIRYKGQEAFIFGRRTSGYFDIRTLGGKKIHASAKATQLKLLETAKTLSTERRMARI
jgi:hypothetical protein